jgi:phosphoribosylformimino-5-aminoimidazole carboxamide ribotide isomerase
MIAYAAVDLRRGRVVQLVGGNPDEVRVDLPDPAAVARQWQDAGLPALHVVDLDAALGVGENLAAIEAILDHVSIPVQVGGGVRSAQAAAALLDRGAARVVVGTRAIEEPDWLGRLVHQQPGRVVLAADIADGEVLVRGWTMGVGLPLDRLFRQVDRLDLAGILVTDVAREGTMTGADVDTFRALAAATRHPLLASGGIASVEDLRQLADAGAAGVVLGMALYTGALDPGAVAREFAV